MALRVPWRDPAVIRVMEEYPTDEIDTEVKLAQRISELTGVSVHRSTINRRLREMRRAQNPAAPQVQREVEEEIDTYIHTVHTYRYCMSNSKNN